MSINSFDGEERDREKDILELANSLNLSPEGRARYIDLQQTEFHDQTAEMKEMVEKLVLIGLGIPEDEVDQYLEYQALPPEERTLEQQDFVLDIYLRQESAPTQVAFLKKVIHVPQLLTLYRDYINQLFVFPPKLNDFLHDQEVDRLFGIFDEAFENHYGDEDYEEI